MEGLLLAATGVLFELGCLNFSLWMRPFCKKGQMILCICPVCGFWNIWCWLCWRQRRVGQKEGEEAFFWKKTAFSVVYFKILSWTSSDCSNFESSGFLSSLQLSFSVLIHVKCKNNTRRESSVVRCSWNNIVQSSSQQSLHLSINLCLTSIFVNSDCITFTCGYSVPLFVRAHKRINISQLGDFLKNIDIWFNSF